MPVVSITRLRVRLRRYLPAFMPYEFRSARQAAEAAGNLAVQVLKDRNGAFWTATIRTSDAAMKKFMLAGAHGQAMRKLLNWCDEASLVHWTQEENELPKWAEAFRRLQARSPFKSELSIGCAHCLSISRTKREKQFQAQIRCGSRESPLGRSFQKKFLLC